jgi:hypothetical protein
MYIVERVFDINDGATFETLEQAEEFAKLRGARYGHNYRAMIAKVEKIVGTSSPCVEYMEYTPDEYKAKLSEEKNKIKALGVNEEAIYD